jgi:hypothetical protein
MIESEYFTIELLIEYLVKYKSDLAIIKLLISKLKTYEKDIIRQHLNELVFYALFFNCVALDSYFLQLCSEDFNFFFVITNAFEIWGHQFISQTDSHKKRIRNILEDCETSMVNGEKSFLVQKNDNLSNAERGELDQKELYNFVIGKRTKNDFKDDVRYFVSYLVKLSYLLISEDRTKIKKIAIDFLHKLNLELHTRRSKSEDCMLDNKTYV